MIEALTGIQSDRIYSRKPWDREASRTSSPESPSSSKKKTVLKRLANSIPGDQPPDARQAAHGRNAKGLVVYEGTCVPQFVHSLSGCKQLTASTRCRPTSVAQMQITAGLPHDGSERGRSERFRQPGNQPATNGGINLAEIFQADVEQFCQAASRATDSR